MAQYREEVELKALLRSKRITSRECANVLGVCPSQVSNILNGFSTLTSENRAKLEELAQNYEPDNSDTTSSSIENVHQTNNKKES